LPCGRVGVAGGLGAGVDLRKYTIDTTKFPNAVCNDGTPAVFYYGAATRAEDRGKWVIFLQGGGGCSNGQACAERWCGIDSNFGMDKMSTSLAKEQIRGNGFLSPDARNRFGTWNRVLVYYCSSDSWAGTKTTTLTAIAVGNSREYDIQFRGSSIVDAVFDTLRNAVPIARRRVVGHAAGPTPDATAWPDLDEATHVLFAGSSGGGNGVINNTDRVNAKLRASNPGLADFRTVIDAIFAPDTSTLDYSVTPNCAKDPARCTYEGSQRTNWDSVHLETLGTRGDESCKQYHAGSEWRCADNDHVTLNHITSPFFIRQDLQDPDVGENFVVARFGTAADFAIGVETTLRNLPAAEEPRGGTTGRFAPQCAKHEGFTENDAVYDTRLAGQSFNETVWNWWSGAQPQVLVRAYSGVPGPVEGCPSP
jgi:hypothetical protein